MTNLGLQHLPWDNHLNPFAGGFPTYPWTFSNTPCNKCVLVLENTSCTPLSEEEIALGRYLVVHRDMYIKKGKENTSSAPFHLTISLLHLLLHFCMTCLPLSSLYNTNLL